MKTKFLFSSCFLLFVNICFAQSEDKGLAKAEEILSLVKQNNASQLSKLVEYPLKRPNPIPDIRNEEAFVAYFPTLFDEKFKNLIPSVINSELILNRNGMYGLVGGPFSGEIWFDENRIVSVNYNSGKERTLGETIDAKTKAMIHPSVNQWASNNFVGKSKNLLIRIDRMSDDTYRYAAWSKGKTISQKPDLVILDGEMEIQGSVGASFWTFKNKNWTYILLEDYACEKCKDNDKILVLSENGVVKSRIILTHSK
jgi:hypothetical protein